ncbi:MAG: acyl-CoA dehydrogenase family protein [Actinomycetota bacterium]
MTTELDHPVDAARRFWDAGSRLNRDTYRADVRSAPFILAGRSELSLAEAVELAEARGRSLRVGPFVAANAVANTLRSHGSEQQKERWLAPLLAGEIVPTLVLETQGTTGMVPTVRKDGRALVLEGSAELVQYALDADLLLVSALHDGRRELVLVESSRSGIELAAVDALDGTRGLGRVTFTGVSIAASDLVSGDTPAVELLDLVALLSLGETIGAMDELFDSALAYSKSRFAFGRPIGSFQVIKHSLVDASLALESSKALRDALLDALVEHRDTASEIASMAKSFVAGAGIDLSHIAWQTYGGIAYTWANDFHLYMRRITSDAALFGDASWHNRRIIALHEGASA